MSITDHGTSWHSTNRGVSMFLTIYVVLYLIVVYLSKQLHERPMIAKWMPEAALVITVGMIAGGFFQIVANNSQQMAGDVAESVLSFDSSIFFIVFLPPIIFNSGYHLHRQLFQRYFTPICLFAFLGTMFSMALVAGMLYIFCSMLSFSPSFSELLAFGALISATDPVSTLAVFSAKKVDPQLFYLLSGESLLNDAVGLVLFEAFAHLVEVESNGQMKLGKEISHVLIDVVINFGGSLILGTILGLLVAYLLKHIDLRHTPLLELSVYTMIMYAPFVLAEICRLSGIVTVLFTGLASKMYAEPNLSRFSSEHSDVIFRLVSHITETLIFLELGLSVIPILRQGFDVFFLLFALLACLTSRALNIYPISWTYNTIQRSFYGIDQSEAVLLSTSSNGSTGSNGTGDSEESQIQEASQYANVEDGAVPPLTSPVTGPLPNQIVSQQENARVAPDTLIPNRTTHFLFLSGLRGAVSYGLVKMFPNVNGNKLTFEVTTMLIVLITTFVFGGMTDTMLDKLEIPVGVDEDKYMKSLKHGFTTTTASRTSLWRRFDDKYLRPFVLRDAGRPLDLSNEKEDTILQEQIEMTEFDHLRQAGVENRTKNSIYDFGQ